MLAPEEYAYRKRRDNERFDSKWKEEDRGYKTPCWVWMASIHPLGYGTFSFRNADNTFKQGQAHRWSYEQENGEIPDGLEIDHLCKSRDCVNPTHLEAVTHAENCRRKTDGVTNCKLGHPLNEKRKCRICYNAYQREYQKKIQLQRKEGL